jgi:peptide/nickel transport system substrate-binding protein
MLMRFLRSAALGAVFGLFASLPALAQTPPGVLIVGQTAEPKSLDPAVDTSVNDFRILVNIYDGLVRYKSGTLQVEPALAKSWKIGDGGHVYTFQLRRDVHFQDGTPFNAQAVKFNFERMLDKDNPYHDTGPFPLAFFFSEIDKIDTPNSHEVVFHLKHPYAPFLSNLAYPTGLIISPAAVEKYGKDVGRHPVGTGPFRFEEWQSNAKVVLTANSDYWGGKPELKAVVFRPITDANTRLAEMLSGGLDVMVNVPADNIKTFREDPRFKLLQQIGPHVWFLILNTKEGIFKDKRVRQAINYAVNKKALADDVLQGTATVANGPTPPAFAWAHDNELKPYPYDPAKARALLKAAGVKGAELVFYVTEGGSGMLDPVAMGTAIQADLAKVGLQAKIETYEWNTFLSKVNAGLKGKADMAEMAWMTNDPDTLPYLTLRSDATPAKGGFNSGYYSNPKVDALLEKARRTTDQAERARLYKEMQVIVHNDAPWLFVANWKQNAVASVRVKDLKLQPSFLLLLRSVSKN